MTPVLAHAGRVGWDDYVALLCPLVFFTVLIVAGKVRRRRAAAAGDSAADTPDGTDEGDGAPGDPNER